MATLGLEQVTEQFDNHTYIALLRGVNVGGHNMIKMAELRGALTVAGLHRVQTYIQSGNVLFESGEEADGLRQLIEHEIETRFGVSTTVVLRTAPELERIVTQCPFSAEHVREAEAQSEAECLYVGLLLGELSPQSVERLEGLENDTNEMRIRGRDVYLLVRDGVRNSKLATTLQKLEVPITMRNWKTMNKLVELARAMGT